MAGSRASWNITIARDGENAAEETAQDEAISTEDFLALLSSRLAAEG